MRQPRLKRKHGDISVGPEDDPIVDSIEEPPLLKLPPARMDDTDTEMTGDNGSDFYVEEVPLPTDPLCRASTSLF